MGCSNAKMVRVEPANISNNNLIGIESGITTKDQVKKEKRETSALSKISKTSADSGLGDGDANSLSSVTTTTTAQTKNELKTPQSALSAPSRQSKPREDANDILKQLRSEGLLASETHEAKSGMSFELVEEKAPKRNIPARLAKLEKRQKRKKLLTQQDIEEKLKKADERRKEAEAERLGKILSVTIKSDIHHALDSFAEHQKHAAVQSQEKVESATENRAKKLQEIREKLKAKEAHAADVRQRKRLLVNTNIDNTIEPDA